MIVYKCNKCSTELESPDEMAGKAEVCPICKFTNRVPAGPDGVGAGLSPQFGVPSHRARPEPAQESGNSGMSWLVFILIFGVGNLILYKTTGWLIIPIRK